MRLLVLFFLAFTAFASLVAFSPDDSKAVRKAVVSHTCIVNPEARGHAFAGSCAQSLAGAGTGFGRSSLH